mgnify:FL=1
MGAPLMGRESMCVCAHVCTYASAYVFIFDKFVCVGACKCRLCACMYVYLQIYFLFMCLCVFVICICVCTRTC